MLLERPGELVTREELRSRLWPDTIVDFEHNLNTAVNKIREVLGDSAEIPRFVETLPRRGYRFIAPVNGIRPAESSSNKGTAAGAKNLQAPSRARLAWGLLAALLLIAFVGSFTYKTLHNVPSTPRTLTRVTFDDGLQFGATWSPDGHYIAYSSDRGGKLDIWVQQISGGDPIQITKGPGDNWAPNWSPDGKYIAFRSDEGIGGLFIVPALGSADWKRKIASFGYYPRWSPDGSQILFQSTEYSLLTQNRFYVVNITGSEPQEIPMSFLKGDDTAGLSAAWLPDGNRISVWICETPSPYLSLWTQSIAGGSATKSELSPAALKQVEAASQGLGIMEWALDFAFSWAPSGNAIYAERTFRGTKNIWRMTVDPHSLRVLALDRLTTGAGSDTELSLSPDGKTLAFTGERHQVRIWMFPFDASRGRLTGQGQPVSVAGLDAWEFGLSPDGKKLAYRGDRAGKWELWETSLADGKSSPIAADDTYVRNLPQWAPDSKHLAYFRLKGTTDGRVVDWDALTGEERALTLTDAAFGIPYDWTPDGKRLLISRLNADTGRVEIWAVPAKFSPQTERDETRIVADPVHDLYQSHFSPDGRWIVFEAASPTSFLSTIYAAPSSGGPSIQVTDGNHWDDKPRWSPDGKTIYFVSNRSGGFYNVFGVRFNPAKTELAAPFQVSHFDSPALMIPKQIVPVEFSLTKHRLVVTLGQTSGSIWMLDHVDQ
jgi:Tol biopolymer transport system component